MLFSIGALLRVSPTPEIFSELLREEGRALMSSVPFLVALCHILDLTNTRRFLQSETAVVCPSKWDRKAWSREHFFSTVGVALDPGNAVLATAFWALLISGEVSCGADCFGADQCECRRCRGVSSLVEECSCFLVRPGAVSSSASGAGTVSASGPAAPSVSGTGSASSSGAHEVPRRDPALVMAVMRCAWVTLQIRETSVRCGDLGGSMNCEHAGDVIEAVGGLLRPWSKRAERMVVQLQEQYGFGPHELLDTLRSLTEFVRAASYLYANAGANFDHVRKMLGCIFEGYASGSECLLKRTGESCVLCGARALLDGARYAAGLPTREAEVCCDPPSPEYDPFTEVPTASGGSMNADSHGPAPVSESSEGSEYSWTSAEEGSEYSQESESSDLSSSASHVGGSEPPHLPPLVQRYPAQVVDGRFHIRRRERVILCDQCWTYFRGSGHGSFVFSALRRNDKQVTSRERQSLWERGLIRADWYCLQCWADYLERPVAEMPFRLGWAARDAKRRAWRAQTRLPPKVKDERFENPDKHSRVIFCDYPECGKKCRGVNAGFFVQTTSGGPSTVDRKELWQRGLLDARFYCARHYQLTFGYPEPPASLKRSLGRQSYRERGGRGRKSGCRR